MVVLFVIKSSFLRHTACHGGTSDENREEYNDPFALVAACRN